MIGTSILQSGWESFLCSLKELKPRIAETAPMSASSPTKSSQKSSHFVQIAKCFPLPFMKTSKYLYLKVLLRTLYSASPHLGGGLSWVLAFTVAATPGCHPLSCPPSPSRSSTKSVRNNYWGYGMMTRRTLTWEEMHLVVRSGGQQGRRKSWVAGEQQESHKLSQFRSPADLHSPAL